MMAKLLYPLGVVTVLLSALLRTASGVTLDQLFIVQSGSTDGGCDNYFDQATKTGILDDWLEEINYSLVVAVDSIELGSYNQDVRVRRAVATFFGIPNRGRASAATQQKIQKISDNLKSVQEFFSFAPIPGDPDESPIYPLNGNRYLFCNSNFLVLQSEDTQALDGQANDILDDEGNPVTIKDVPEYAAALGKDAGNEAWWSGDLTPVNGYYFSPSGGRYCDIENEKLGLTAAIQELAVGTTGQPKQIESVILCDLSFTDNRPESYSVANAAIVEGTNLATVVPRSATLLHEGFHLLFGVDDGQNPNNPVGFLEEGESYDLAKCIYFARTNPINDAQRNPENYVFFVTHMYYLFGEPEPGSGSSIDTNWDFGLVGEGGNRIYGAIPV